MKITGVRAVVGQIAAMREPSEAGIHSRLEGHELAHDSNMGTPF